MQPRKKPNLPCRGEYMRRPLFTVGFTFAGCLMFAAVAGFHLALAAAGICVLIMVIALAVTDWHRKEVFWAALFSTVAALSLFCAREYTVVRPLQCLHGQTVEVTAQLVEEVYETESALAYFAVVEEGDLPEDTKLLLWVRVCDDAPELYDRMTTLLYLEKTDQYRADGAYLAAWAEDDYTVLRTDERPFGAAFHEWRRTVIGLVDQRADGDVEALIRAVCFGDKTRLSEDIKMAFQNAGLSHLMAVSGLHVTTVAMALFSLLCFFGTRRRAAALLSVPIPFMFAALTGFSYSALRAAGMLTIMLCGLLFRRQADGRNSLGGALLILLLIDPNAVYDLGLQLSATATLGILVANGWFPANIKEDDGWGVRTLRKLGSALLVTVAAVLATLPIMALTFGRLAVLSPVSNLLAQPVTGIVLIGGCLGTLFLAIPGLGFLASPLFLAAGLGARYLLWLTETISALPAAVKILDQPYLLILCCAAPFLLVFSWRLLRARGLKMATMLLVIAFVVSNTAYTLGMRGVTTVTAAYVDDGTAVLLLRDKHAALIVAGDSDTREISRLLTLQGIDRLDFILYTETVHSASRLLPKADAVYAGAENSRAVTVTENDEIAFWGDSRARLLNGWLWLDIGDTCVLLCPEDGDAADLIGDERVAALALFDGVPPRHAAAIFASQGVLCCAEDQVGYLNKALPTGDYPICITSDSVSFKTRGQGDLT